MVIHACRVVPDDELSRIGFLGDGRRLFGCGVHRSLAAVGVLADICRLVVERLHTFNQRYNRLRVPRVGAVGVALNRLAVAMMLGEQKAAGRHFVLERDSGHGYSPVLKDHLALARMNGVEHYFVRHTLAMVVK